MYLWELGGLAGSEPLKTLLCLLAVAGAATPLTAQELCRLSYSWSEVLASSSTPVTNPNGMLDPGEGARITLSITLLLNGQSAIGHTTTFPSPPPPGWGTIRGMGSWQYDLLGDQGTASAAGTWSNYSTAPFLSTQSPGTPQIDGSVLRWISGGQFVAPGGSANPANGFEFFHRVWTPASYASRNVNFLVQPNISVPDRANSFLVCYGFSNDPPYFDMYIGKYVNSDFGAGINIQIVPAPASLFALAPIVLRRRRRVSISAPSAHLHTPAPGPAPSKTPAQ